MEPLFKLDFHTDAAGAKYKKHYGQYVMVEENRHIC